MPITRVHIIKFIELALAITCMALHYHSQVGRTTFHELMIISAAFGGYIVILVGILTGIFTGQPVNIRIDIFYSLVGCALFIAAGAFVIQYFDGFVKSDTRDIGLAKGAVAIINGVVFLVDSILSFRGA
jgi:hypothetical protein